MTLFFELLFLFALGAVGGWIIELFFRRFVGRKWVNPGFLNGPYLPMYGVGCVILYCACLIPLPRWALVLLLGVALTAMEYVTGLIFIKGMKIKLWDYSDRWGNIQGIICPLFSFFWLVIAAVFVYFLYSPFSTAAEWVAETAWMILLLGVFYGIFLIDLCITFQVSLKIRKAAQQFKEAVHYEEIKVAMNERRKANKEKRRFLLPFLGQPLRESVADAYERSRQKLENLRNRKKEKAEAKKKKKEERKNKGDR